MRQTCDRCSCSIKIVVTVKTRFGRERLCRRCAAAVRADGQELPTGAEPDAKGAAVATSSNVERVNRMCATFGLQNPFGEPDGK